MTGEILARRIKRGPFEVYSIGILPPSGDVKGFMAFLVALILKLGTPQWNQVELQLADLRRVMSGDYSYEQMNLWLPVIKHALEELGRHDDADDKYPWNSAPGACVKGCFEYWEPTHVHTTKTSACVDCGRRWSFNGQTWRRVLDPTEFDDIRLENLQKASTS